MSNVFVFRQLPPGVINEYFGGGGKGGTTTSSQTVSIPPEVLARYNAVNARAETTAEQPFQQYGGEFVAPLTPTQVAGTQATNAAAGQAQPYYGAATALTLGGAKNVGPLTQGQIGYYQNPYTQAVVNPTVQALQQQQGQQLAEQQAQAIKGGAFGGDRANLQRSQLQGQQNLALGQAIAPLYQQGYGQAVQTAQTQQGVVASDLARQMQAGQQVAGLGTGAQQAALQGAQAQLAAGQVGQQTQQAQDTAQYQQFLQERGYPFQVAQFLANIAMGTGALSGSTTSGTQTAPGGFFSDKRLKNDVKEIGETHDGQPIYSYKYNGDDRTQIGLMAQDVEKKHPDAVGLMGGYKTVDYKKATEGAERTHKDVGGGLMPQMLTPEMEAGDTTPSVEMSGMTPENAVAAYNSSSPNPTSGWGPRQDTSVALRGSWRDLPASRLTNTPDDRNSSSSAAMWSAPGARYGRAMGGGLVPDGFDPNSMGGAVSPDMAGEAFMRGGYVGGGLVDANDWASIVAANKQALGVYGGAQPMGGPVGATGIVPAATIPVPKPIEAAKMSMPAQRPSGMSTAMQTGKDIAGAYSMGKAGLIGSAKTAADPEGSAGLIGGQGEWGGKNLFSKAKELFAADGGLIVPRHAYADGGGDDSQGDEAVPYDPSDVMGSKDPMEGVLKAGSQKHELLKPAQMQTSGGGGGGSSLGLGKMAGSMIGSAFGPLGSMAGGVLGGLLPFSTGGAADRQAFQRAGLALPDDAEQRFVPEDVAAAVAADQPMGIPEQAKGLVVERPVETQPRYKLDPIETKDVPPHLAPLLNEIGGPESGNRYDIRYGGVGSKGKTFDPQGFHPEIHEEIGDGRTSTAAGRFMFTAPTWRDVTGGARMTEGYQNAAAIQLARDEYRKKTGGDLDTDLKEKGVTPEMKSALAGRWEAFAKQGFGGARPPGVMGGTDVRATPSGAEGKKSIGDVVTSEGFIVPALGFLGSMLASDKRNLGQALGEGIMGGVGAYQGQQKLSSDVAKKAAETELEKAKVPYTQMQTKAVQAGIYERRFIPDVGWQVINKADNTVFYVTDANMNPIKGTGLESTYEQIPVAPGSVAPKTSTSVITPSGARETDITKLVKPAQNVMEWKPVTSVPVQFQPKVHMATQQDEKQAESALAEGTKVSESQTAKAEAASRQRMNLQQMMDDFNKISDAQFLGAGSGAEARLNAAKAINTTYFAMTGKNIPGVDWTNEAAALESIKKGSFRLGANLANSIGAREPGFIVAQSVQANPNIENSPTGFKIIASGLLQNALYEQDKKAFYDEYFSRFKHLRGASEAFDKVNPPEMYAKRAVMSAVDPVVIEDIKRYKASDMQPIIDKKYGRGTYKILTGG